MTDGPMTLPLWAAKQIHSRAMPAILRSEAWDVWLEVETEEALELARPLPADRLKIVAKGVSKDDRSLEGDAT